MKRQPFSVVVSSRERRNADLFFAELMGSPSLFTQDNSEAFDPNQFLRDLLDEPTRLLPSGKMHELSGETWGEGGTCPTPEEVRETWRVLLELRKLVAASSAAMEDNPLIVEVRMLKQLLDVLDMANQVPRKVWGEIWNEFQAFADCDVKPLVERVKKGEKNANAVLRVLHGLSSIPQGYVHDRIDDGVKKRLKAQSGFTDAVAKAIVWVIKKQVPVIQREISANNFTAVATAFQDMKTELEGKGVSVTGVWNVVVALGKEIIGSAIDDAIENTARWAAKKVAKRLLGTSARAATVIFLLEEIALFVHALVTIADYKERLWASNKALLAFVVRMRPCVAVRPRRKYPSEVGWKIRVARVDCKFFIRSFIPVQGGKPGEGEWKDAPVKAVFEGKKSDVVRIDVPATEPLPGRRALQFKMPRLADWPSKDDSFVAMDVTTYDSAGKVIVEKHLFMAACAP